MVSGPPVGCSLQRWAQGEERTAAQGSDKCGVGAKKLLRRARVSQAGRKRKRWKLCRKLFNHIFSLLTRRGGTCCMGYNKSVMGRAVWLLSVCRVPALLRVQAWYCEQNLVCRMGFLKSFQRQSLSKYFNYLLIQLPENDILPSLLLTKY